MSMRDLIPWGRQENRAPTLYRDEVRDPVISFRREIDRLFDDAFRGFGASAPGFGQAFAWPAVEVSDHESEVRVTAEMPGLRREDVELSFDNGLLAIRGERKAEVDNEDRGYSERFYGRFELRHVLPSSVDADKAHARFADGVLTVTLPKRPEPDRSRRIPIDASTRH